VPDRRAELNDAIDDLIVTGAGLFLAEGARHLPAGKRQQLIDELEAGKHDAREPKKAPDGGVHPSVAKLVSGVDFKYEYQRWYSKALRVVEQLLPDRYQEFRDLYMPERRKTIDAETYGVADYIAGLSVTERGRPAFDSGLVAIEKLNRQLALIMSAKDRFNSVLADISGVVAASVFDSELEAARDLVKAKHVRAAGVVAGVVLERHLRLVLAAHNVTLRKKPTIANLNDAAKEHSVYGVPEWRRVQLLADIRNICSHSGDIEPTAADVEELLRGVDYVAKTVF
jgi:hypothetical protein